MKAKFIIIIGFILLSSCGLEEYDNYEGFTLGFGNNTNVDYNNSYIYIGGMKNSAFVVTDSIKIPGKTNGYYFIGKNKWKPDLRKIKAIPSDRCYFFIKLSDQREELIESYDNQTELFSLKIPNSSVFIGDEGTLIIAILDDKVTGYALEGID